MSHYQMNMTSPFKLFQHLKLDLEVKIIMDKAHSNLLC